MSSPNPWHVIEEAAVLEQEPKLSGRLGIVGRKTADTSYPQRLVVLLHPYAPLGGSLDDHVISALWNALLASDTLHRQAQAVAVLKYNARGVDGHSRTSWTGFAEAEDLKRWIAWSIKRLEWQKAAGKKYKLYLVGYSYGTLASSLFRLEQDQEAMPISVHYALISYPLSYLPLLTAFRTARYRAALEKFPRDAPVLLVYGTKDNFTNAKKYEDWCRKIVEDRSGQETHVRVFDDDHFWSRSRGALTRLIFDWIARH